MQANLGSSINYAGLQVSYTYGARYLYTDIVILNDNFLRLSACVDAFQTPMSSSVITVPAARPVQYMDRQGNPTHRVRLTAPHTELTILAVGNVRLISPPWAIEEMAMSVLSYDAGSDEFLSPTPMVDPEKVADAARQVAGVPVRGCLRSWTAWSAGCIRISPTFAAARQSPRQRNR